MNAAIEKTLAELEEIIKNGNPKWNISQESGIFLNTLIKAVKAQRILEIGTSNGYSGIWIAQALSQTNGKLITIESHIGRFHEAKANFARTGLTNFIEQILGHAPEILPEIEGPFDLMFFDATKAEHIEYFKNLNPKLKKGGIIITDNSSSHAEKLSDFFSELEKNPGFQNCLIPIGSGLLLSLKTSDSY